MGLEQGWGCSLGGLWTGGNRDGKLLFAEHLVVLRAWNLGSQVAGWGDPGPGAQVALQRGVQGARPEFSSSQQLRRHRPNASGSVADG